MGKLVQPKVFLVGCTSGEPDGIQDYLNYTGQEEFAEDIRNARNDGLSWGEILCSMFAKLCYRSLVLGKNANVRKVREIRDNLKATHDAAHGSVFEHCLLNFVATDVSRVLTHELVRHRTGTAFSQTSGRYCRLDSIDLVWDPILDPVKDIFQGVVVIVERAVYEAECKLGLRKPPTEYPRAIPLACYNGLPNCEAFRWVPDNSFDFDKRKKITSAIRRIAPNGQSNEIAFSINIRTLRHCLQVRTAPAAEWEIRSVFSQVYHLIAARYPLMLYGAKTKLVDDLPWVYGMKLQPYEVCCDPFEFKEKFGD